MTVTAPPSVVEENKSGTDVVTVSTISQMVNAEHYGNEGILEANDVIPKNEETFGAWMLAKKPLRKRMPKANNQGVINANHVVGKSHASMQQSGSRFGALNGEEADSNPLLGFVAEQAKSKGPNSKFPSKAPKQVTKAHSNPKARKEVSVSQKKTKNNPPAATVPAVQHTITEISLQDKSILAAEKKKKEEEILRLMKIKEKEGASFLDPYMVYYATGEMEYLQKQQARGKHIAGEGSSVHKEKEVCNDPPPLTSVSSSHDAVLDGSSISSFKDPNQGII
ncbi:hypothetical protein RIF29_27723 [Crotalaria pallida]|uniref:Uncharacterized protein n=1 Tax=Crotalaria pallida TaxID=3830 RepID=A0AAN9HZ09_CROPI